MTGRSVPVTTAISAAFGQLRCDEDMQALLDVHEELRPVRFTPRTQVTVARHGPTMGDAIRLLCTRRGVAADETARVTRRDFMLPAATGRLPARIYTPAGEDIGPLPIVLYLHGGGWVLGSLDADDASAAGIALQSQAVVVSVGYRLAPEHRFPAAWSDALAAFQWVLENADVLRGDATRIALAGEGSGGNLALGTALAARSRSLPAPAHVLAVSPVTQTATNTQSWLENAVARPLNRAMMAWCLDQLAADPDVLADPRLQLVDADLAAMPPVTLISARLDPLRTDAQRLHGALGKAGVPVEWREYPGVTHGFFGAAAIVQKARQAQEFAGQRLAEALARPVHRPSRAAAFGARAASLLQLLQRRGLRARGPAAELDASGTA